MKVVRLRECPNETEPVDTPVALEGFWRRQIQNSQNFDGERESLWVFLLNTRARLISFQQLSQGTKDTVLVNVAEVFRLAAVQNATAIIIAHNHPSGDPTPSEADIKVTREIIKAAAVVKIELLDHVIIGDARREKSYRSLKALGYFVSEASDQKLTKAALATDDLNDLRDLAEELNQVVVRTGVLKQVTDTHLDHTVSLAKLVKVDAEQTEQFGFGLSLLLDDVIAKLEAVSKAIMNVAYDKQPSEVAA